MTMDALEFRLPRLLFLLPNRTWRLKQLAPVSAQAFPPISNFPATICNPLHTIPPGTPSEHLANRQPPAAF